MISEVRLREIENAWLRTTKGTWRLHVGREGKLELVDQPVLETVQINGKQARRPLFQDGKPVLRKVEKFTDPRWDIYAGPEVAEGEQLFMGEERQQIMHLHPEAPMKYHLRHWNLEDAKFAVEAHNEFIPELLEEIRRLHKILNQKGETNGE